MRRLWLCSFHRNYVKRQIALRKGECRQCGTCCDLGFRCVFLKHDGLCRIYHSRFRPVPCVEFPIDPRDIADVRLAAGRECGYRFEGPAPSVPPGKNPWAAWIPEAVR